MNAQPPPTFRSRRSPVYGLRGIVATSQPLASAAGAEMLSKGGNAADAAIAAAAALNVVEPTSTGIGGDMFALYYDARTKEVSALNGSGRAPAALTLERLQRENLLGEELPMFHAHTVTVPGACAGWLDLNRKHGLLPISAILAPAIRLAEEGFPVSPLTAHSWARGAERQLKHALNGDELLIDGRAPRAGEIFRNPNLAKTFKRVAEKGAEEFYRGEIAEAIADVVQKSGGCMTVEDLAAHVSTWEQPISVFYRGLRVYECPPNGQGIVALMALNLLAGFELPADPLSPRKIHLMIEALRLAFADARWYVADPAFARVPVEELLSQAYADQRRKLIDPNRAALERQRGTPTLSSNTVYLSVVDKEGNACSFINSNYAGFGTGVVPKGWGFTLQNRGHNFRLDPRHPNCLAPRKRPYHTIIPALATREADNSLYACYGVMGGFMQPQGHVQVFSALADNGLDPQAALDLPRFCIDVEERGSKVAIEEDTPQSVIDALQEMGHALYLVGGYERALFGRGQVILRDAETGALCAGSDMRADGCAVAAW